MYFGDSGGIRVVDGDGAWDAEEVVLKLFRSTVVDAVFVEALEVTPHSDGRGIGGGILTDCKP